MKSLALAALALALTLAVPPAANAQMMATLVSCRPSTSVTGRFIYVGTYQYAGRYFEKVFESYCPPSIMIY